MILQNISILNYKNIAEENLKFSNRLNCFIGKNGEGKTNLLDAIFYLSFCKSNYSSSDANNIKHDEETMMLKAEYEVQGNTEHIHCGVKRQSKKTFKRNNKDYKRFSEHIGLLPLVMIAPADISIIIGGNEERRKFIDSIISQYDKVYLQKLVNYNNLLQQRNKLLKHQPQEDLLLVLSEQMAGIANYIYEKRLEFVEKITPIFQEYYNKISANKEPVSIEYSSQMNAGDFIELTKHNLTKDLVLKHTSVGIHRDNLEFILSGYPIRKEGSQGQKKSYLIALKLAQFDFIKEISGKRPILLLDDIFDKLDTQRVQQIINLVSEIHFGQIFITDTDKGHIDAMLEELDLDTESSLFKVENGKITSYA
ncbi:DNA replication and repair protein RecF [Balneicella halophila]|uniref:DNA replication and repair protein RecF n=1 Tax=Balneicella halophila TaxID=1537566 RepID=A0A7L4UPG7_BALHA|nr:DNA replication/repair protein RecF [Balneicella halophila]PVX51070.1 DNA replication and repair protein RecF [Balneicella halophila]